MLPKSGMYCIDVSDKFYVWLCMLYVYVLKLLAGFFGDKVWLFLVKTGWHPCFMVRQHRFEDF